MYVLGVVNTIMYGDNALIVEDNIGDFIPLSTEEWTCENFVETTKEEFERLLLNKLSKEGVLYGTK